MGIEVSPRGSFIDTCGLVARRSQKKKIETAETTATSPGRNEIAEMGTRLFTPKDVLPQYSRENGTTAGYS